MRNLKRALSLTLASVMLLGMMVVGSSAAVGYDDVSEDDNVEAIEVLQAIEVMVGDERGFGPERSVNRAEMAVVMAKLLSLDYNYYSATCPFNDVYDWARGYVGACAANGIVSGRGDGIYDPGATVTAVEAASMLMRALGYFKYSNDYADGFEVSTVRQGTIIGIFDNVGSSATEPMTRNQVAQMVLNALQSAVVEPDGNTTTFLDPNGSIIATTGKVNYVSVTSNKTFASAISRVQATAVGSANDGWIVELGERLYNGDLRLTPYDTDAFERPARTWEYDGKEIGTYVKKELLRETYTEKVTGRMLYDLLSKNTIETYDFVIAIDGETEQTYLDSYGYFTEGNLVRTNTEKIGNTGKGVLTEVYVDTNAEIVYIAVINTFLAKANADYNEKKEEATFEVWSLDNAGTPTDKHYVKSLPADNAPKETEPTMTVKEEDFDVTGVKKDDIVLFNVAKGEVQKIIDPEIIDDTTISSFKKGSWVNAAGTQYDYADTAQYDEEVLDRYGDTNMKETNYRVFLDQYGYMIGLEIIEAPSQYAFLTGIDGDKSNIANKSAKGNLIFTDGTMKTVTIDLEKSKAQVASPSTTTPDTAFTPAALWNTWCTYSVSADGVYTLTEVAYNDNQFTTDANGAAYTGTRTDKVGQGRNNETADRGAAQTPDSKNIIGTIDKKQISLVSDITNYKRTYGNENSVYIVAGTKRITDASYLKPPVAGTPNPGAQAVIIDSVDSIITGVQNASLDVFGIAKVAGLQGNNIPTSDVDPTSTNAEANTASGAYTLFKDDGYVIASVVIGEDNGVSSIYAYVTGNVKQEDWRDSEGNWKWYRDVIIDGEETTLEEISDNNATELNKMSKNNWFEVKLKADGTVKSVQLIDPCDAGNGDTNCTDHNVKHSNADGSQANADDYIFCADNTHFGSSNDYPKFVGLIEYVEQAQLDNSGKVVLFENMTGQAYKLSTKGNSLQVQTAVGSSPSKGFSVSPNAKIVLVQDKAVVNSSGVTLRVDTMDIITTNFATGGAGLDQAIKFLNENSATTFRGYISAVFENGFATSVVIYDTDPTKVNQGSSNQAGTLQAAISGDTITITGYTSQPVNEIADVIVSRLKAGGYTDIKVNVKNGMISGAVGTRNNTEYEFTVSGVPTAASLAAEMAAAKAAVTTTITVAGHDPVYTAPEVIADIQDQVETLIDNDTITVSVEMKDDESFTGATNESSSGGGNNADDTVKYIVTLTKGSASESVEVTATIKGLAYASTNAGKVADAKTALAAAGGTLTGPFNACSEAYTEAQTAINDATLPDGVSISLGTPSVTQEVVVGDSSTTPAVTAVDGTFTITVTVTCRSETDTQVVSFTATAAAS